MNPKRHRFSLLFEAPSGLTGAARAIDFFGQLSALRHTPSLATDVDALHDDWRRIGEDLLGAIRDDRTAEEEAEPRQLELFD